MLELLYTYLPEWYANCAIIYFVIAAIINFIGVCVTEDDTPRSGMFLLAVVIGVLLVIICTSLIWPLSIVAQAIYWIRKFIHE